VKILTDIMAVVSSSQYFKMREMKIESRVSVMAFPMLSAIWNLVGGKQDSSAKSICFRTFCLKKIAVQAVNRR